MTGVVSNVGVDKVILSNMVLIDNGISAAPKIGKDGPDLVTMMRNMKFYGDSEARDCK